MNIDKTKLNEGKLYKVIQRIFLPYVFDSRQKADINENSIIFLLSQTYHPTSDLTLYKILLKDDTLEFHCHNSTIKVFLKELV